MKRFRFPLRPVAVIRAHREMQARQALGAATAALNAAAAQVAAARVRGAELEQAIAAARTTGAFQPQLQVASFRAYQRERAAEAAALKQLDVARTEQARRRAACVEAHRQVKVVAKLEARARATHRTECLRSEQAEIDERAAFSASGRSALALSAEASAKADSAHFNASTP